MPPSVFPVLETERLLLREIVPADAAALFAIHGDAEAMKWFGSDPLPDEAAALKLVELFAGWRALANPGTRWGLQIKGQDKLIGTCGLFGWQRNWRRCTVGYELHPLARGSGYMHEALRAILSWGWQHMELNRIEAQVHPDNADSLRSLRRLGFAREGLLRQAGYWAGRHHDLYQYSLLREDWRQQTYCEGGDMTRQIVFTSRAAKPPATYSQAVKAGGLVFVSGTAPADPETGQLLGATIQEQTRQCLRNISAILEEAGSSLAKAVSLTVILADEDDFAGMNEEWLRWFPENPPARQGAKLPVRVPGLKISIAAIAEA